MPNTKSAAVVAMSALLLPMAGARGLPAPSRTVFKCDDQGTIEVPERRQQVAADAQRRCQSLDMLLPNLERAEALAPSSAPHPLQSELLGVRAEYRRLGC